MASCSKLLDDPSLRVVSFDVFDTVLTRLTAQPTGIFSLMAQRMYDMEIGLSNDFIDYFCEYRIDAERKARSIRGRSEITIDEIYQQLSSAHKLDPKVANRLYWLEIEVEDANLVVVPMIAEFISQCRHRGKKVTFISDMYLSCKIVTRFLDHRGLISSYDSLYISSQYGVTKRDGGLFKLVLDREGCLPSEILHIGDNYESDIVSARRLGLRVHHFQVTLLSRYETMLLGDGDLPGQIVAGTSRFSRLCEGLSGQSANHRALHRIGSAIAGPLFTIYVLWVGEMAKRYGVQRLYFVARDGQVLHEIACHALKDHGLELRYLYGSRQAWHLPSITRIGERELEWMTVNDPHLTVRILAGRVLLDPIAVKSALSAVGIEKDLDVPFNEKEIRRLRAALTSGCFLADYIINNASSLREQALGYFRQEGLFEGVSWALVDLGWFGNMQDSLQKILREADQTIKVRGFYFGLLKAQGTGELKHSFLFSAESIREELEIGCGFMQMAELFACADHGSTIRYQNGKAGYQPVLKEMSPWIGNWGIEALRNGIIQFARNLPAVELSSINGLRERLFAIMARFYLCPKKEEAEALGEYRFSSDQGETFLRVFAPPLTLKSCLEYICLFTGGEKFKITFWLHGSRVRSRFPVNVFLKCCSYLLRGVGRIRRSIIFQINTF